MDSRKTAAAAKGASRQAAGGMAIALALVFAAASYAPAADARGRGHGARIAGGVVLGAVIARPLYAYARPVYYAPPVYIEQPGRGAPPAASLSVEERLRRLQSACSQGLLSATECAAKRQELLRLM